MLGAATALGIAAMQPDQPERKHLAFTIWITTPKGPKEAYCLLDSGAESNFIQQRWAKQYLPDIDSPVRQVRAINDTTVKSYGSRELNLIIADADAEFRDHTEIMESVDISEYDAILGFPWLETANPIIDWSAKHWQYRPRPGARDNVDIISPQACAIMLEHGDWAYMVNPEFHESKVRLNAGYTTSIVDTEETPDTLDIPMYYTDFLYIFLEEEAGILASHDNHDHGIDIEPGKSPPLKLIYPLS